ncbi:MAG: hypothetical protein V3U96_00845 [Paracoccaceae bacterium]
MVEYKKKLGNVAFGGAWSEELLVRNALSEVMTVLHRAADECTERDVSDGTLMDALGYVRDNVEKGPMLVAGLQESLLEPNQSLRQEAVKRYVSMIAQWAGV